ncbi:MAG: DUF1015 family protein, partial [Acidimicrobiaceae bacterium]
CHCHCHPFSVPQFEPFRALRYSAKYSLGDVCAQPYDVQSDADRESYANRSTHNIVHLDLPVGPDAYREAAKNLSSWIESGALQLDAEPSFTLYRMKFVDTAGRARETVGVIGALRIEEPNSKKVLPHEQTTPKAKTDRLDLTRATQANLSPIWGLSLTPQLSTAFVEPGELLGAFTDEIGVQHIVERVSNRARCAVISKLIAQHPVVIADGHHRYAISRTYRDENPQLNDAKSTLCYINELIDEQLSVAAIHRLYSDVEIGELLAQLQKYFDVIDLPTLTPAIIAKMSQDSHLTFVAPTGQAKSLKPKPEMFAGVRNLDSVFLEHALADIDKSVSYQHGFTEVTTQLKTGKYTAAILIRPVSVAEIQRTAAEGILMPPQSTFFTPKLQTGLAIRPLSN